MEAPLKSRIAKLKKALSKESKTSAILLSSNPLRSSTADSYFPFRPNSSLFYFTGLRAEETSLIVRADDGAVILIAPEKNPTKELWDGAPENITAAAKQIGAKLIRAKSVSEESTKQLCGVDELFFDNNPGSISWQVTQKLISQKIHSRGKFPSSFHHFDKIITPLRLKKDKYEINQTRIAIQSTLIALDEIMPYIAKGVSEYEIAASLEYWFRIQKCEVGFSTIVGAGPSGAALHYNPYEVEYRKGKRSRKVKSNDSVLIDCGASWNLYSADITRVFPGGETFTPVHREIYEIVLASQKAAIKKIKHGVKVATVYNAAAKVLTQGLKDLGVLRGNVSDLIKKEAFKKYFPHSIGHSLGLDVHDISNHRGNSDAVLEEGMVFTVEPGLYFSKKTGKVPACGFRIEDDILVTRTGSENLSKDIPKEVDEVESWHANALYELA